MSAAILLLASALLFSVWAPGADAAGTGKNPVRVSILTGSQKALLKSGLAVRVASGSSGRVALRGFGRSSGLFRARTVRFAAPGKKVVLLALSARGRKVLSKCGALSASVSATATGRKRVARASSTRRLRALASGCFVKVPLGANPERCDFLDPSECLYPFANDYFTRKDSSTVTGRRLDIDPASTPANTLKKNIAVTEINRGDGFSPGNMIVSRSPGSTLQRPSRTAVWCRSQTPVPTTTRHSPSS